MTKKIILLTSFLWVLTFASALGMTGLVHFFPTPNWRAVPTFIALMALFFVSLTLACRGTTTLCRLMD